MPAASTLGYIGWAVFGVAVRGFQLGVMEKPLHYNVTGYVYSAGFWTGIGYFWYQMVDRNDALFEQRYNTLRRKREQRALLEKSTE